MSHDKTTASDNDTSISPSERPASTRVRWRFPLAVLVLAIFTIIGLWFWADGDQSMLKGLGLAIGFLAGLFVLLWFVLFSGVRWRTRLAGLGILGLVVGGLLTLFEMNGQTGAFVPQFKYRFAPSAEEEAVEYFGEAATNSDSKAVAAIEGIERLEITAADWPRFGGAQGDHIVRDVVIRRDWDTHPPKLVWRHPVGPGWSSFAFVGDLAFTQEQRGEAEAVVCYDARSGEQIWVHTDPVRFEEQASGAGPRATPTIHDSRLYAQGATGVLNCLNPLTGHRYWSTNIVDDANTNLIEWGMAGSPYIYEDLVIVNPGGKTGAVAAYDRLTGEKRWAGGDHKAGYASPQVATLDGVPQVLIYCSEGLCGHDLKSGKHLWSFEWTNVTGINCSQPIVLPDQSVFVSSGYGSGSARVDVSKSDDQWKVEPRWTRPNRFKLKFNGGIFRDGYIYGLDEGILSCFDVTEGERTWKKGRYNFGQLLMVGNDLLVSTEKGEVALVEANPESMKEVAKFQAIEGKTWNHPVVNRGLLYVRNSEEAACYDLRPETAIQ